MERNRINVVADLHVHTTASGHAYSTVNELTLGAKQKGLEMIAITDHGPALPGGAHLYHFWNLRIMPEELNGVKILKGVEANIINDRASLDIPDDYLEPLQIVLAGFHPNCGYENTTVAANTQVLIKAMENKFVDIIVHPGNARFPIDPKALVEAAANLDVVLEINNSSFLPTSSRQLAIDYDLKIAHYIAEFGAKVVLSSDAHIYTQVGEVAKAVEVAVQSGIKPEQVLNSSIEKVLEYLKVRRLKRKV